MPPTRAVLDRAGLDALVGLLTGDGYRVIGPTVRGAEIVLAELASGTELPSGWGVQTAPGRYRLHRRDDEAVFAHSAGSSSWKRFLHPPDRTLWSQDGDGDHADGGEGGDGTRWTAPAGRSERMAFLGVRACDLAGIATLAGVLADGPSPDASFTRRRRGLFVVAAGCTEPGGVCFCASMGTGPAPGPGYDLALTERLDAAGHRFLVEVGSADGAAVLDRLPHRAATPAEVDDAHAAVDDATGRMGRAMPPGDLRTLLIDSRESARWQDVADRCLTCGNCTMVCPTCFCTSVEDRTDLDGGHATRSQRWASCFELDFSELGGGSVRTSGAARYRQWLTHKLGTWHDQFGTSGCVGCGRCIAWCPTGIDITAEVAALAAEHDDAHR